MYNFINDYSEGAHQKILDKLVETNLEQTIGYGQDPYTEKAKVALKNKINKQNVDIHFIPAGTQTNIVAISSFLKSYEAVISAETGHINVHETGAIEHAGHKVLTAKTEDGKLTVPDIVRILDSHSSEHMVKPAMVYISNPTELGTIYSKEELENLYAFCQEKGLLLYLDGARLANALTSKSNDLTLETIANNIHCFYVGGTKNGALFGEALVIVKDELKENFRYYIKQNGALLAKGRLLGIQFLTLFTDHLYEENGAHANAMAEILRIGIKELGYEFLSESDTNQIFPIFPNTILDQLAKEYGYETQMEVDDTHTCIRLVTSWATIEDEAHNFVEYLKTISSK